ncbi:efflux transporter outer membrane subunit [Aquitalea sp. USM4]|uniref:efflux transporter outer membrane subunit n=1 Tax=Aquitalea sp. USM4 TaxID=1590041 RepID=UPI00103CFF12|nr:efflux transporter outer membrane subunit [Aquitalea sp. USM4]QBJ77094.1 RND transporter [Aquitalea sp. USM4]
MMHPTPSPGRQAHSRTLIAQRALLPLLLGLGLSGCTLTPPARAPQMVDSQMQNYGSKLADQQTAASPTGIGNSGISQHLAYGQQLPAEWWQLFRSPALDKLVREALQNNPSLGAARAALKQAEENYNAAAGSLQYPSVSGQLGGSRQHQLLSGSTPSTYNVLTAGLNVSYSLDLFGANRQQLLGLMAATDYQRYQLEATYQTLIFNVVTTAIQEASQRAQLQATQEMLAASEQQLRIVEKQAALGGVARSSVLSQATLVAQTRAQLSPLEKALDLTRHQLAVYVGKFPSEQGLPEFTLDSLQLPAELPVSLPSELVRQRPDIRASEALLQQAGAAVGVATANQYPQINLTGSFTRERLFVGPATTGLSLWSIGAGVTQSLFDGGSLRAKKRAADAAFEQAQAQYRDTVLKGFQNVADSLRAVSADASTLQAQTEAEARARETLQLTEKRFRLGAVSQLALLDAQRTWQQARISLISASASRHADSAALFLALGGGWWNRNGNDGNAEQSAQARP